MKKNLLQCIGLILLAFSNSAMGQIGISTDNPKSTLDVAANSFTNPSNNSGVIIPRVTSLNTNDAKEKGLLVFLNSAITNQRGFYWWNGTEWKPFLAANRLSANKTITYISAASTFKEGNMNENASTNNRTIDFDMVRSNDPENFDITTFPGEVMIKKKGYYYIQAASFISKTAGERNRRDQLDMKIYINNMDASLDDPENFNIEGTNGFPVKFTTISINASGIVKLKLNDRLTMKIIRSHRDGSDNTVVKPDASAKSNVTLNFLGDF